MTIYRLLGDVTFTWQSILVTSVLGGVIMSFLWMYMLRAEVAIATFVYSAILIGFSALVLITLLCFTKSGILGTEWLPGKGAEQAYDVLNVISGANSTPGLWKFLGVVGTIACLVYLLLLVAWRRRIKFAVEIFEEAAKVVSSTLSLPLFHIYMTLWIVVLFLYFIGVFSYIVTSGEIENVNVTLSGLANALDVQVASFAAHRRLLAPNDTDALADALTSTIVNGGTPTALQAAFDATLSRIASFGTVPIMICCHFWGCLWTFYVLKGATVATVAFVACSWYWTRDKSTLSKIPVLSAHKTILCAYFGSIVLGAFLQSVVMVLRLLINYVYNKTKGLRETNRIILCVLACIQGCIKWVYKIIKYVTMESYSVMCMFGNGYCESMKAAYEVLKNNIGRVATLNFIAFLITNLSKVIIMCTCVYFEHLWLSRSEQFLSWGRKGNPIRSVELGTRWCRLFFNSNCIHVLFRYYCKRSIDVRLLRY